MYLVDEVYLEAALDRGEGDIVEQLPGLIDLGPRCRIHLQQVYEPPLVDLPASTALVAGPGAHALLAIQRLGQDTCQRCLTHPPGAGKQVGMVELVPIQGVAQGPDHMLLAHHVREGPGAPFTCQHLVGHAGFSRPRLD